MSGTPCFTGTRVPVTHLFDYLEAGDTLDHFLTDFPSVTRDQTLGVLELLKKRILADEVDVCKTVNSIKRDGASRFTASHVPELDRPVHAAR
jgi:uncharacterized protein (DUF433 family)